MIRKIIKYINKGLAILLCSFFALPFFGCAERAPIVQSGIQVTPSVIAPYSKQTEEYAKSVIYELLEGYFKKTVMENLPEATVQKLLEQADNLQKITAKSVLTEEQYVSCMTFLKENTEVYTDALARLEKGEAEEEDFEVFKHAYIGLASKIGSNVLGAILYELCIYRYDYEYDVRMERYEKYGYSYLKADAEAFAEEKRVLQEEVGEGNFISVMQTTCFLSDLFFGGAFEEGQISSFSDHEILALLQEPSVASIAISGEGWELLLGYLTAFTSSKNYGGRLLLKAKENGDLAAISAQMDVGLKLFSAMQKKLTVKEASLLRQNEWRNALSSIFASFGEGEWALVEALATTKLQTGDYEAVAKSYYGEAFEAYRAAAEISSLDELKTAAGTDSFLEVLEGYIAGISPAFSYGLTL